VRTRKEALRSRSFARDRRTWVATLILIAVVCAGTSAWLSRRVPLATRRPAGPGDDGRFVVLAYDRIVPAPDRAYLDRFGLRQQLRALAAAGWQAVTLDDIRSAFRRQSPLPARPILVTFDEGYLDTYEAADPVLRELRWPAVMFLRTARQEERDVSFLFWDRLRRMVHSGLWEVASSDPAQPAPAPPPGAIPDDLPGMALISERLAAPSVPAWAPRGLVPIVALGGQAAASGPRGGVEPSWLGFMDDPVGANTPDGDPYHIARLRVDPRWSAEELLRRVDLALAGPSAGSPTLWVGGEGTAAVQGDAVRLEGGTRAELWIPSARWVDDWSLEARVRVDAGEFWVVQPAPVAGREWRLGVSGGNLYVEDRSPGSPPVVLARAAIGGAAVREHRLRVVRRGRGLVVTCDGRVLGGPAVALPERWRGKVGLVAYRRNGDAAVTVSGLAFASFPYKVRAVSRSPTVEEVGALARDAEAIAALAPAWVAIHGSTVSETRVDSDLFRILAHRYAWEIVPSVVVAKGSTGGAVDAWLGSLPERVRREGWDGVRLDLRAASGGEAARAPVERKLRAGLQDLRKRLIVVTP
jgi:polysaccharide deacetylase